MSPGIGANVITIPIETILRKKIRRYRFTFSRFFLKNLNIHLLPGGEWVNAPIIGECSLLHKLLSQGLRGRITQADAARALEVQ
jgi:hypothetical protein